MLQGEVRRRLGPQPEGLRCATFQVADRVSLVHLASIETGDGHSPLARQPPGADELQLAHGSGRGNEIADEHRLGLQLR
jgi:hypothetical protein